MRRTPLSWSHARETGLIDIAGVYAILDLPYPHPLAPAAVAKALIDGGARIVQVRAKSADGAQRRRWIEEVAGPCRVAAIPLIVNDDLELAELVSRPGNRAESGPLEIAGVHLGQTDLDRLGPDPTSRRRRRERLRERGIALGISTHDLEQLRAAEALDPDYVAFGPVFATTTKADPDPVVGLEGLARACDRSKVPVVGIGGIDSARAPELARAGASAIAAIGALTGETVEIIRARTFALASAFEID